MAYIALARKWRPAQFSDIVGQGPVVRTLMNAIRTERVHPAYLLTGSRGIGKTSIARILAKAVRCEQASWVGEKTDWLKSCDQCPSCREIAGGTSVDVIEIDGASNNGVDAVREIRENAKYLPASGSRKIYIIDEVHMLTTAAFNALLKTIEEPPAHVIFVFATTEPHKIPSTILSRCQRFDLRRVTAAQVQTRLAEVITSEKIEFEPGALALIARASEGSMRDALSLLDQVIAFSGQKITTQSVRDSIGLIEGQTLTGILRAIFERKPLSALELIEQAYNQGHDLRVLTRGLIEFLHAAILVKIGQSNVATVELSEEEWGELHQIAPMRALEEIELIFQVLHHGLEWIARSPQPKIVLDVLVVKCATAELLVHVGTGAAGGAPAIGASGSAAAPNTPPSHTASASPSLPPAQAQSASTSTSVAPLAQSDESWSAAPSTGSFAALAASIAGKPASHSAAPAGTAGTRQPLPTAVPSAPPAASASTPLPASAALLSSAPKYNGHPADAWEALIAFVRQPRPLLASILEHASCGHVPGQPPEGSAETQDLLICFDPADSYFREQLQSKVYADQLGQLSREFFGGPVRIRLELRQAGESLASRRERERSERETAAKQAALNHPIIAEARALFGGELGPIELTGGGLPRDTREGGE